MSLTIVETTAPGSREVRIRSPPLPSSSASSSRLSGNKGDRATWQEAFEKFVFAEYYMLASGGLDVSWVKGSRLHATRNPFGSPLMRDQMPSLSSHLRSLCLKKDLEVYLDTSRRPHAVHKAFLLCEEDEEGVEFEELEHRWMLAAEECSHLYNLPPRTFPQLLSLGLRQRGVRGELWVEMECVGTCTLFEHLSDSIVDRGPTGSWRCAAQADKIAKDMIAALSTIAQEGWLFFDSKPSNWVLANAGSAHSVQTRPVDAGSSLLIRVAQSAGCPRDALLLEWVNVFYALVNIMLCGDALDQRVKRPLCAALRSRLTLLEGGRAKTSVSCLSKNAKSKDPQKKQARKQEKRVRKRRKVSLGDAGLRITVQRTMKGSAASLLGSLCVHSEHRRSGLFCPVDLLRKYAKHWSYPFADSWLEFFGLVEDQFSLSSISRQKQYLPQGQWAGVWDQDFCDCKRKEKYLYQAREIHQGG